MPGRRSSFQMGRGDVRHDASPRLSSRKTPSASRFEVADSSNAPREVSLSPRKIVPPRKRNTSSSRKGLSVTSFSTESSATYLGESSNTTLWKTDNFPTLSFDDSFVSDNADRNPTSFNESLSDVFVGGVGSDSWRQMTSSCGEDKVASMLRVDNGQRSRTVSFDKKSSEYEYVRAECEVEEVAEYSYTDASSSEDEAPVEAQPIVIQSLNPEADADFYRSLLQTLDSKVTELQQQLSRMESKPSLPNRSASYDDSVRACRHPLEEYSPRPPQTTRSKSVDSAFMFAGTTFVAGSSTAKSTTQPTPTVYEGADALDTRINLGRSSHRASRRGLESADTDFISLRRSVGSADTGRSSPRRSARPMHRPDRSKTAMTETTFQSLMKTERRRRGQSVERGRRSRSTFVDHTTRQETSRRSLGGAKPCRRDHRLMCSTRDRSVERPRGYYSQVDGKGGDVPLSPFHFESPRTGARKAAGQSPIIQRSHTGDLIGIRKLPLKQRRSSQRHFPLEAKDASLADAFDPFDLDTIEQCH